MRVGEYRVRAELLHGVELAADRRECLVRMRNKPGHGVQFPKHHSRKHHPNEPNQTTSLCHLLPVALVRGGPCLGEDKRVEGAI